MTLRSSRRKGPNERTWESPTIRARPRGHTAKVQYTANTNGLIVHNARHSPGRVHDVRVYRMKHPTLPSDLPSRDGSDGKRERVRARAYMDRGYPGAQKMHEEVEVLAPIRRKPGKNLSALERSSTGCTQRSASTWSTPSTGSRLGG